MLLLPINLSTWRTTSQICHGLRCTWHVVWLIPVITIVVVARSSANTLSLQEQEAFQAAVRAVEESVVQIRTVGGLEEVDGQLVADGPTTGLVVSPDGYIVSSAFNFAQRPASTLVTLPTGQQVPADLVASDHSRMIVLLKVHPESELAVPEFVPADEEEVGAWAIAVGRTLVPHACNVSVGILSAKNRMFGKALQTDAAVSPANYGGPLIDLWGRVYGLLVPLAPRGTSVTAGTEWYDSGIGFAVPLASMAPVLERMKQGEDQYAGVLGIGLKRGNPFEDPATVAIVRPGSPAADAGLQVGDRIVNADGEPVFSQTSFRVHIGPRYAGDVVHFAVDRAGQQITREVTLSGPLGPFRHAYIGVLPMRHSADSEKENGPEHSMPHGVDVRMVLVDSPAERAGIRAGDRIVRIDGEELVSLQHAIDVMNRLTIGTNTEVTIMRSGESQTVELVTAELSLSVPADLPPAREFGHDVESSADSPAIGMQEIKLSEFTNECRAYVPACVRTGVRPALLLWLQVHGGNDSQAMIQAWKPWCEAHDLLLLAPTASNSQRWGRRDVAYLKRLLRHAMREFPCDPHRIVVHGEGDSGKMAYLFGLAARETVRGVSIAGTVFPRRPEPPDAEPSPRLAFFSAVPSELLLQSNVSMRRLHGAGYAVHSVTLPAESKRENDGINGELARWIDTLDRF